MRFNITQSPIEVDILCHVNVGTECDAAVACQLAFLFGKFQQFSANPHPLVLRCHGHIVQQQRICFRQEHDKTQYVAPVFGDVNMPAFNHGFVFIKHGARPMRGV